MANFSLNQLVYLRQPASEYISQCYQISARLTDLIEALKMLLESFQVGLESAHSALDNNVIPYADLEVLNTYQKQGSDILREAADDLAIHDGFEDYSKAVSELLENIHVVYKENDIGYDKTLSNKDVENDKNQGGTHA